MVSRSLKAVVIVGLMFIALAAAISALDLGGDPLDQFEALRVIPDPVSNRYAVTYQYFHADSSKTVFGIWLGTGTPPAIGSTKPAHGLPAASWTGALAVLDQTWVRGHLVLAAKNHADIKLNRNCLFDDDAPNMLCLHTRQVEFIDPRQRCDAFSDKRQKVSAKFFWLSLTCYRLLT
jgi:hypothetical protein